MVKSSAQPAQNARTEKIAALRQALRRWERAAAEVRVVGTGIAALDEMLPGGGWPRGRVSECVGPSGGGRLTLLLQAAAQQIASGALVALVDAVGDFHAPGAWRLGLDGRRLCVVCPPEGRRSAWTAEQLARSGRLSLVILHRIPPLSTTESRRLRAAAEAGSIAVVLVGCAGRQPPGTVALRLRVRAAGPDALEVELLRAPGAAPGARLEIGWPPGLGMLS